MTSNINKFLSNFVIEFDKYSGNKISEFSSNEQFLFLYAYYHYFNANSSSLNEILNGNTFRPDSDDHVTGIYLDEDSDNLDVDALIVYFSNGNEFEFPAVYKCFKDAEGALCGNVQCRKRLQDFIQNEDYKLSGDRQLKIKLITNYVPKTASQKRSMNRTLQSFHPTNSYVTYQIAFGDDIEYEILEIESPKEYVDEGIITIDKENNYLSFGNEVSIIVNASANSIKNLYELYGYRGLFAQNLRYYVKNAKIDKNIVESIQDNPDNFWYFNNGVIIICSDYLITKEEIKLFSFSIINGGQTTKLIGETEFEKDFYLQCKIIKNKYNNEEQKLDFIADVAEASNTQKPIKDKDLIANKPEQRRLKKQLSDVGIYCQVKRGEKVNKKLYPDPWQNTTNEELGQLLLSFIYQMPGTARGNKTAICGNEEYYQLIFGKKYSSSLLADLLLVKSMYKQWIVSVKKEKNQADPYRVGLINNGLFFMIAVIGVIAKLYYRRDLIQQMNCAPTSGLKLELVSQHDIGHGFLDHENLSQEKIFNLFEYCYSNIIRRGYEILKTFKVNYNSYSNFTKTNTNYATYIVNQIALTFHDGFSDNDLQFFNSIFYKATDEDLLKNMKIIDQYVHVISIGTSEYTTLPEEIVISIKDALSEFRSKKYKELKIMANEVFTTNAKNRIALSAPKTIEELASLHCMDKRQLNEFGNDIINIVSECVENYKKGEIAVLD